MSQTETKAEDALLASIIGKIRIIDRELNRHSVKTEEQIGIPQSELLLLRLVGETPGQRLNEIAKKMAIRQGTSSNIKRSLVAKGLIEERFDPADKRCVYLHPTDKGKDLIVRSQGRVRSPLHKVAESMTLDELLALDRALERVTAGIEEVYALEGKEP